MDKWSRALNLIANGEVEGGTIKFDFEEVTADQSTIVMIFAIPGAQITYYPLLRKCYYYADNRNTNLIPFIGTVKNIDNFYPVFVRKWNNIVGIIGDMKDFHILKREDLHMYSLVDLGIIESNITEYEYKKKQNEHVYYRPNGEYFTITGSDTIYDSSTDTKLRYINLNKKSSLRLFKLYRGGEFIAIVNL